MHEREEYVRVPRTARYRLLGEPASAEEIWVAVHGYGQLAERFARRFHDLPGLREGRRAVVVPEALNRFYLERQPGGHGPDARVGATWMTRVDREHEISDYVEYLDRVLQHAWPLAGSSASPGTDVPLVLLGFSQGAETASRWAVLGPRAPATLVLWGGGLAEDLEPSRTADALRETRIVFVVGNEDRWADGRSAGGLSLLRELGLHAERIGYKGGHRVEPDVLSRHWP